MFVLFFSFFSDLSPKTRKVDLRFCEVLLNLNSFQNLTFNFTLCVKKIKYIIFIMQSGASQFLIELVTESFVYIMHLVPI